MVIVDGLKAYCSQSGRPCEVVRANQTGPVPSYPYIAYTITTPVTARNGTYSRSDDGTCYYTSYKQTWSFTIQSDDADEAMNVALRSYDWFRLSGLVYLNDNAVVVLSCSDINNRDNLITIEYEFRQGFDVVFNLVHTVEMDEGEMGGYIETSDVKYNET